MKSIKWKLVIIYLTLVLIVMITSGIFILWRIENHEYTKIKDELKKVNNNLMQVVFKGESEEIIRETLYTNLNNNKAFYSDSEKQIYILDKNGKQLFPSVSLSSNDSKNKEIYFSTTSVIAAINGEDDFDITQEKTKVGEIKEIMSYAYPIKIDNEVKIILYTREYTDAVKDTLRKIRMIIVFAVIIALGLTAIIGFIFASTLTGPIKALTDRAKEMSYGNLNQRIPVKSNDEIGQLTKSFNHMAFELNRTLLDISKEKNKLETVFAHMKDGIVAFNSSAQIIHANPVTYEILGFDYIGDNFYYLFEKLQMDINFTDVLNMRDTIIKKDLSINNKYINAIFVRYLNSNNTPSGVVLMLQDITEQRKLEDMRKEFVANVSHELRTPLTAVKLYVETLLDDDFEDKKAVYEFLETINSETDRMTLLIEDLLELSKLDKHQIKLELQEVDLAELLKKTVLHHMIHAKNKKQSLNLKIIENLPKITIDPHRITQVISNIISNAIKYTLEQGSVYVYMGQDAKYIKVIVEDTGFGIPQEDLHRIFERFYRVDKARSREMGGTGLGLAIAKELIEHHGGKITIDSVYGKGTKVTTWFLKDINKNV